jgi:hypothetical protein
MAFPRFTVASLSSPFGPSLLGAVHTTRCPSLLRPLLTSRSTASDCLTPCHPFRHKARSPQVIPFTVPARAPDLRSLTLDRESFAVTCPLALSATPLIRFLFVAPQVSLLRFFQQLAHARRLAVRSGRCDQLPKGLTPPSEWSCWAHTQNGAVRRGAPLRFGLKVLEARR